MLARYRGKTICPKCGGTRLKENASWVKVSGKSITELVDMPVSELKVFFDNIQLTEHEQMIAKRLLVEIKNRLTFLVDVGLGYLTLNRLSNSLSGGESQRINLVTSLGSSLVGSLYILDEPSIGLHSRDTERLISVLRSLQKLGNTVVVVEHDEDTIRSADWLVDVGPLAGKEGGEIIYSGAPEGISRAPLSITGQFMTGKRKIKVPSFRREPGGWLRLKDVNKNNLKHLDVSIPLQVFSTITGVSGSGKSTLMNMLGCLDVQTSGEYKLDGLTVNQLSERRLSQIRNEEIGFIFQTMCIEYVFKRHSRDPAFPTCENFFPF